MLGVDHDKLKNWSGPFLKMTYEEFLTEKGIKRAVGSVKTGGDKGMIGEMQTQAKNPGGIDLNPEKINIDVQGQSTPFNFFNDPQILSNFTIQGLQPIIINITPITNASLLLGRNEVETEHTALNRS